MRSSEIRMISFLSLVFVLLSLSAAAAGVESSDRLVVFALPRDSIILPCGIPSSGSCSSINWKKTGEFGSVTNVVMAGRVTDPDVSRFMLLEDCSLRINQPVHNDARLYTCDSGAVQSSVSLQILELVESSTPAEGTIQLQCFLNTYKGFFPCNNRGVHLQWTTEDNTPLYGKRFVSENSTKCFSKLNIKKKITDHHRKWKCHLIQNGMVQASIGFTTTIQDGVEEVFAAVGESLSLSCGNISSYGVNASVEWAVGGKLISNGASPLNEDSSLLISEVNAGEYQCSESNEPKKVLNKIRLHTLNVIPYCEPGGENLTLTCVLNCTEQCDKEFNLTWSGSIENSRLSSIKSDTNTLRSTLFLPVCSLGTREITCSVQREGVVMASKKWHSVNSLETPAWFVLPLGLLVCTAVGGLYMYRKRKHKRDATNEQSSIGMIHVYDSIQEVNTEEQQQQRQWNRQAATATCETFYDLLQAVN
ncbi:uncharacterized protein LOC115045473 [Echeneis naucrates]|uniref:uncharacterized protein LOC115045473 n=1 Tax=Echeneis naucrates TaxID=173247 RepID=UPI0011136B80|nr:uncharacterized protein LOC115045473 [Echeneis naucrates]